MNVGLRKSPKLCSQWVGVGVLFWLEVEGEGKEKKEKVD